MIVLAGGDVIVPGRIVANGSVVIDGATIVAIETSPRADPGAANIVDVSGCYVVPGFIDVHVHGVSGVDVFEQDGVTAIAARLPRHGVTAFCPTTIACDPAVLRGFLAQVGRARVSPAAGSARVLPAHLESNFLNPEFAGAQPLECLRVPARMEARVSPSDPAAAPAFSGQDILDVVTERRDDVGIVTVAPEIDGGLDLVRSLTAAGLRVSLGHSGADFDAAIAAIDAGARHATHLYNRMAPMTHRAPGLAGAVLSRDDVIAELICDGYHVHPAICRMTLAAKGPHGVMAITDGTAGAGLAPGSVARLGSRSIRVGPNAAELEDGTLAGSTLTMDGAFAQVVTRFGGSLVDAAAMCAATPARALGLSSRGVIAAGAAADLVVLDRQLRVVRTLIAGAVAYQA